MYVGVPPQEVQNWAKLINDDKSQHPGYFWEATLAVQDHREPSAGWRGQRLDLGALPGFTHAGVGKSRFMVVMQINNTYLC